MKRTILSYLLHPVFIAFILTATALLILPNYFSKYKIELVSKEKSSSERGIYFQDLDGDSFSEKIVSIPNTLGNASFMIYTKENQLIDQWNFNSMQLSGINNIGFHDIDEDGFKEISLITRKANKAFLHIVEPLDKKGIDRRMIFIDSILPHEGKYQINAPKNIELRKSNGENCFYFSVNSGFSGYPRAIYSYNFEKNTMAASPHLTNSSYIAEITDVNKDGKNEVLIQSVSYCNDAPMTYSQRSDWSAWLSVLDSDLNFLFDPIEFKIPYSSVKSYSFTHNGNTQLISFLNTKKPEPTPPKLLIVSSNGVIQKEHLMPVGFYLFAHLKEKNLFRLYNRRNGSVYHLDYNLNLINEKQLDANLILLEEDLTNSGTDELITISYATKEIKVYQDAFNNGQLFSLPVTNEENILDNGVVQYGEQNKKLYVHTNRSLYILSYGKNPLFYFKYLYYLAVFGVLLGLIYLVLKGQEIRESKKRAIENQIAELQLKTIKNQVDPHFVFNAINTISDMTLMDDKMEADQFICEFSSLMRKTLASSDKIVHTIEEELDYLKTFVKFQQIRYQNSFQYVVTVDPKVNIKTTIPKHMLYTYVENAIKHGLSRIKKGGLLKIDISNNEKSMLFSIENNGPGISTSDAKKKDSTGNGIRIMHQLLDLYAQRYNKKISTVMANIKDETNTVIGVKAEIRIPLKTSHYEQK